jgi:hypothetical protein
MMALILPMTVLSGVVILIWLLESHRTPDWQVEVNKYLQTAENSSEDFWQAWAAEAQHPDQLATEMLVAVPTNWTWQDIVQIPPPESVRCIRLEKHGQDIREYLLVSFHSDGLWHTGWLVHRFREEVSEGEKQALFAELGCNQWAEFKLIHKIQKWDNT